MDDPRLKKLLYRADHRGFREADIIIGGFARARLAELSPAQVDAFEQLLDQPDQDLYAWIIGREAAPEVFEGEILAMLRAFMLQAHTTIGADTGA
ncbi:MAG TPA: succinate dehydrogenase assembly factor 2 [Caulobacteraceae bacterium]|nr:succinate dehydrogenase assembly factor 2 [Caulobacteraceae bacterium]